MDYEQVVKDFCSEITTTIASHLDQGQDVAVIVEGRPVLLRLLHVYP